MTHNKKAKHLEIKQHLYLRGIKIFFELTEYGNITCPKFQDAAKLELKGKFIVLNCKTIVGERSQSNNLSFHLNKLEKKELKSRN